MIISYKSFVEKTRLSFLLNSDALKLKNLSRRLKYCLFYNKRITQGRSQEVIQVQMHPLQHIQIKTVC